MFQHDFELKQQFGEKTDYLLQIRLKKIRRYRVKVRTQFIFYGQMFYYAIKSKD